MSTLSLRGLPPDIVALLKSRAHANGRSLEAEMRAIATAAAISPVGPTWRCFHCGDVFTDRQDAAAHFGIDQLSDPGCVAVLRNGESHLLDRIHDLEQEVARYRAEDGDLMRWYQFRHAQHGADLRSEEEKGYARGLKDGRSNEAHA